MSTSQKNRILMVDDDEGLLGVMSIKLKHSGYTIDTAEEAKMALNLASTNQYDVLILDVTMPGQSGIELCQNLRLNGVLTPILMLSGKTEKENIIKSLEGGADDYITKPFNHTELVARLRALVRRNKKAFQTRVVGAYALELDVGVGSVIYQGNSVRLTRKETVLLKRLICEAPNIVERSTLFKDVWEINNVHTSNRLDVYIRRLRSKLEDVGAKGMIQTVRGSGYRLVQPRV